MESSKSDDNRKERRSAERFKSGISVLVQKRGNQATSQCILIDISIKGFAVRLESRKLKISVDEEFFLVIDPSLFQIETENVLKFSSLCKRVDPTSLVLGAIFIENDEKNKEYIQTIVKCIKSVNENEY